MRHRPLIVALALALGGVPCASADALHPGDVPPKARELAERGRAAHDAGDYAAAIAAFQAAYVLAPSPGLLFDLAQSYRLAGNCDDAVWMYRRYLESEPPAARRALAEDHLHVVERCAHVAAMVGPVPPAVAPRPPLAILRPLRARPAGTERDLAYGLGIGGGLALGGAAYFAIDAHDASQTVAADYAKGLPWSMIQPIDTRGRRSAEIADVLGVAGGAAVVSGVVLYYLGWRNEHVTIAPTAQGGSLAWSF